MPKETKKTSNTPQTEVNISATPETEKAVAGSIEVRKNKTPNIGSTKAATKQKVNEKEKTSKTEKTTKSGKVEKTKTPVKTTVSKEIEVLLKEPEIISKELEIIQKELQTEPQKIDLEFIQQIPLEQLHAPEFNPFNIKDDDAMERLVESIAQYGIREPGLVRPLANGNGFELIAGNRRRRASEIIGLLTMPVIVREMDDDNAVIALVDSNMEQRDELLFSEKAWAYKMKLEALNHRGSKAEKSSAELLAEQTGDSRNQIFRFIRLTELVIGLLDKVDENLLAFNPAVELSYLSQNEQLIVVESMEENDIKPSLSQAVRLKKLKQSGELTDELIKSILAEEKPDTRPVTKEVSRYKKFFPVEYTIKQMHKVITDLLESWQKKQIENNLPDKQKSGEQINI